MTRSETLIRTLVHGLLTQLGHVAGRVDHDGDAEALHDYRVVLRKLRVALRLSRRAWGKAALVPVQDLVKREYRTTGRHRDRDVVVNGLLAIEAPRRVLAAWQARTRDTVRPRAHDRSAVIAKIDARMTRVLDAEPRRSEARKRFVARAVRAATLRARDHAVGLEAEPELRHEYRVSLRRLRYTIELLAPYLTKSERRFARNIDRLQRTLGDLRDVDLTRAAVGSLQTIPKAQRGALEVALAERRGQALRAAKKARKRLAGTPVV